MQRILIVQRGSRYGEKVNRGDKGAIGAKNGLQKRLYPTFFDVEQVNVLIQNASYRFKELWFLLMRVAHFCKKCENIWPESET